MDFELEIRKYQKRLILKPNDNEMDFDILRSTHPKHTQKLDFSFLSNIILSFFNYQFNLKIIFH